jgi:hypothetical protein
MDRKQVQALITKAVDAHFARIDGYNESVRSLNIRASHSYGSQKHPMSRHTVMVSSTVVVRTIMDEDEPEY